MERIKYLLKQFGPMLSGNLAKKYEEVFSSTNEAARKAISRARSPVQKLKVFPFEKNQVFCYLEEQYNSSSYKETLYNSLKQCSATIAPLLIALESNYGIIPKNALPIYSISPISNTRGHRLVSRNIDDLLSEGIILEYDNEHYILNGNFFYIEPGISYSNSNNRICKIIVNDFISWAAKLNIIAFNSATIYPDIAEFSHFQWHATCPSYMQPIYDYAENKPGFLVVDAIYGRQVTPTDISYFIGKVNIIRHFKNAPNFLPVILVNNVTPEALKLLKEHKIFIGILSNLYDDSYATILSDIYNVFQNATAILLKDSSKIDILLENISKSEGRFNNVMGDLFEYMVGSFYNKLGVSYLEMNKLIPNSKGTKNELDILVCRDNKIIAIECKATKSPLSFAYIEKWLSEIIPTFRKWIQSTYPQRECEFQIWSIGGFDDKSISLLETHKHSSKKYSLNYYCKSDILKIAQDSNDTTFIKQINKHFSEY